MADINANNENIPESLGCKSCLKPFKFYLMFDKVSRKCYLPNKCQECVKNNYNITSTAKGSLKQLDRNSDVVMENSPTFAEALYVNQGRNYELTFTEKVSQDDETVTKEENVKFSPSVDMKKEDDVIKSDKNNNKDVEETEEVKADWKTPVKQEPVSEEMPSEVKSEPILNNFSSSQMKKEEVEQKFLNYTPERSTGSEKIGPTSFSGTSRIASDFSSISWPTSDWKPNGSGMESVSPKKSNLKPKKLSLGLPPLEAFKNCKCVNIHSKECIDRIACKKCGKIFRSSCNLQIHMRIHTGYMPYTCPICSQTFNNSGTFWKHKQTHMEKKPFSCNPCKVKFYTAIDLRKHNARHHIKKNDSPTEEFECKECCKTFKSKHNLRIHMRIHTGSMPYKCSICSQKFNNSGTFWKHRQTHQESKPFSCQWCPDAKFYTAIDLRSHNVRQHKAKNCHICGKKCTGMVKLRKHIAEKH